ncbi:MAG: DUF58 domain-containing protein [Pseudomonadales bacterium]
MSAAARLISPQTLAGLANLELLARVVVEGALIGLHRSPRFGFSQEFAEYRAYTPGDDPRFIDWNVFARADRTYVKRFFGTTNTRLTVLVDTSASMGVPASPGAVSKLDYARFLAAALIHVAARQHDAVGLSAFAGEVHVQRPPAARARAIQALYHDLDGLRAAGGTHWSALFEHAAGRLGKRGLTVLLSDCFCAPEELGAGLRALAARGHDLLVFQILDPAERQPSAAGGTTLEDVETGVTLTVSAGDLARDYPQRLAEHVAQIRHAVLGAGGHHRLMSSDEPLDQSLAEYLRFRERHP